MSDDRSYQAALNILRRHRDTGGTDEPQTDATSAVTPPEGFTPLEITITPRDRPQPGQGEGYQAAPVKPSGPLDYIANIPARARQAAEYVTYPFREPSKTLEAAKDFASRITPEDVTRGVGYNAYNLLGTPVDIAAQGLKVASHALPQGAYEYVQRNLEKPIMGSEWLKEKAVQAGIAQPPQHTPGELVGEIGGSFIDPAVVGTTAAATAAKVVPAAAAARKAKAGEAPAMRVDATLGQKDVPPVTFRNKEPGEWSGQDWGDFGRQYGVPNLGPTDEAAWRKSLQTVITKSGREITIPGGEGPFTYYDLLHLKAQGIDPNDLPTKTHQYIHDRMVGAIQPGPGGPSNEQIANQMMFGMISPNQPLTPNELALQRAMVKGPEDLNVWANMVPYNYKGEIAPIKERQELSRNITKKIGVNAASEGGLGASGSANYADIAEFAQKMKDRPDFFRFNPDDPSFKGMSDSEKWASHVTRILNEVRGLKAKTGSLASVWQDPQNAAISAIDRHMATKFRRNMFPDEKTRTDWEKGVITDFNAGKKSGDKVKTIDELLDAPGGRGVFVDKVLAYVNNLPAAVTRNKRTGEFNPSVPEVLRQTNWVGKEPEKVELIGPAYTRALEANAKHAKRAGQSLFSNQWMLWDRIRGRLEPHEILFPGLEKLPRMNLEQMRRVRDDLSKAGYMAAEGTVRPLPSASRAGYFGIPVAAGAAGAAAYGPQGEGGYRSGGSVERDGKAIGGAQTATGYIPAQTQYSGGLGGVRAGGMQPVGYGGYSGYGGYGGYGGGYNAGQSFYNPGFWSSLLQSLRQPQGRSQSYTAPTYAQMMAQANPGGQPTAPAYTPPPAPAPAAAPAAQPAAAVEQPIYDPIAMGFSGHTAAHGGRIEPHAAYKHAMKIATDAAPSHGKKTAAAGRRYKTS
jgi:hypothetical protein